MTEDWVAAGSSEKPAVSAGRPLGKTCRCICCTCRSRRSIRCSGDGGGWRWPMALDGRNATAALAASTVIRRDFTSLSPRFQFDVIMHKRGLRVDESYWTVLLVGAVSTAGAGAGGVAT